MERGGGGGGRRGEQQNTSDRHALWITLPGDSCAAKRHGNEQYQHVSRKVEELVEEEPKKRIITTLIFSALCVT